MQIKEEDTRETELKQASMEKIKEEENNNNNNDNNNLMAYYLNSLKQELEETRKELQQLKSRETDLNQKPPPPPPPQIDLEIEELKFVENTTTKVEVKTQTEEVELQKKRSVKFASPPLLTKVIVSEDTEASVGIGRGGVGGGRRHYHREQGEGGGGSFCSPNNFSEKKVKRNKPLIPLIIGSLFSKKKGAQKSNGSATMG